jgi:hypothetical protein
MSKHKPWLRKLFDEAGNFDIKRLNYWPRQDLALLLNFSDIRLILEPYHIVYLVDAYDLRDNPSLGMELIISPLEEEEVLPLSIRLSEVLETFVRIHPLTVDRLDFLTDMLIDAFPLEEILLHWHLDDATGTRH